MPKKCAICKTHKDPEDFHKDASRDDGRYPYCKPCRKEFCRKSYYDNPTRQRDRALAYHYGITRDDLNSMAESQHYCCAICNKDFKEEFLLENHKHIHVDHCHESGKVRGLLCQDCNHVLGKAKDNTNILKSAIKYLQESKRRIAP